MDIVLENCHFSAYEAWILPWAIATKVTFNGSLVLFSNRIWIIPIFTILGWYKASKYGWFIHCCFTHISETDHFSWYIVYKWAIFQSCVKLPEGNVDFTWWLQRQIWRWEVLGIVWRFFMTKKHGDITDVDNGDTIQLLVGGLVAIFHFPIYWEFHHPNWFSYFSEGWPNHQPDYIMGVERESKWLWDPRNVKLNDHRYGHQWLMANERIARERTLING